MDDAQCSSRRKSSRGNTGGNCVEVKVALLVTIRRGALS